MFCPKCGNKLADYSAFCPKCGAEMTRAESKTTTLNPTTSQPLGTFASVTDADRVKKPNKKIWGIVNLILIGIAVIAMLVGYFMSDGTDHVELVYSQHPFENESTTATYKMVIDKYFTSPRWTERKGNGDEWYVDVSGQIAADGDESNIMLTFKVTPEGNKYLTDSFWLELYSIDINGELNGAERASSFIMELFDAYDQGYENMNDYYGKMLKDVFEDVLAEYANSAYSSCAYALYDIDANGVEELLVRGSDSHDEDTYIYTYAEGKTNMIGEFWSRNRLYLDENGNCYSKGSNGADSGVYEVQRISDDGTALVTIEVWENNGMIYTYTSKDGEQVMSESEYWQAIADRFPNSTEFVDSLNWQTLLLN